MTDLSFTLAKLSDTELFERTSEVAKREKETTVELLYHLHEVERRKLYALRGFGSLWDYVMKHLGYSETQTYERISAMRLIFRVQEAKKALEAGTINVTQAAMAERHLRAEEKEKGAPVAREEVRQLITEVQGKTKRETEKLLLSLRPREENVQERIQHVSEELSELRFGISDEVRDLMERYWELRGKCSVSELFSACLKFFLDSKDPVLGKEKKRGNEDLGTTKEFPNPRSVPDETSTLPVRLETRSRYIPVAVKREVRKRCEGRCEYSDPLTRRRCDSRYLLQFDHIEPYGLGGTSELSNLRMLCATHNGYLAKKMYVAEPFLPTIS